MKFLRAIATLLGWVFYAVLASFFLSSLYSFGHLIHLTYTLIPASEHLSFILTLGAMCWGGIVIVTVVIVHGALQMKSIKPDKKRLRLYLIWAFIPVLTYFLPLYFFLRWMYRSALSIKAKANSFIDSLFGEGETT